METPHDVNKTQKHKDWGGGEEKKTPQKTPKNQKRDKVHGDDTLWLHSLLRSETRRHHKRSYMTSLHPVKVKALRDTGEILFVDTYAQVTGFSVHSLVQVLPGPFSVRVAFSTLTRSALCIRINLINVHESVSLSLNQKVLGGLCSFQTLQRFCSLSLPLSRSLQVRTP